MTTSKIRVILISAVLLLSSGCATTNSIESGDVQDIKSVTVLDQEALLQISYSGPGQAWAMGLGGVLGGAIGGAVAGSAPATYSEEQKIIFNFLKENDIDVKLLVRQRIKEKLSQSGLYIVLDDGSETSDASFIISDYGIGFHTSSPLSRNVRPTISFQLKLLKPDGKEVWTGGGFSGIYSVPVERGRNLREWMEDKDIAIQKINESVDFAADIFITYYTKALAQ